MAARLRIPPARLAAAALGGAGFGFLARDVLELGRPAVAAAWLAGAFLGVRGRAGGASGRGGASKRTNIASERGTATVEWTALTLIAALALGALAAIGPGLDGRAFGGFLAHRIVCALKGGCNDGDAALARAYGDEHAALARSLAPNLVYEPGERSLPVDWRRCRERACSDAPDDPDLDVHRSDAGEPATAFVRRLRRGGRTYFLYWLYYPDSNSTVLASDKIWNNSPLRLFGRYPGFHPDDWEGYAVRVERDGGVSVRATSHGHWQGCKHNYCRNLWTARTGWTRVSRGSHAGHIPLTTVLERREPWPRGFARGGPPSPVRRRFEPQYPGIHLRERTTTAEGLRLIPLETLRRARRRYRPLEPDGVSPPWRKRAWRDPEDDGS